MVHICFVLLYSYVWSWAETQIRIDHHIARVTAFTPGCPSGPLETDLITHGNFIASVSHPPLTLVQWDKTYHIVSLVS